MKIQHRLLIMLLFVGLAGAFFGYSLGLTEATQRCVEKSSVASCAGSNPCEVQK